MQSSRSGPTSPAQESRDGVHLGIVSTEDDDNNPSSIGYDQSSRLVMNSSAPAQESGNLAHLNGGTADDTAREEIGADEVAIIFSFLSHSDIMRARVCTTWRDAAKKTIVPPSEFVVNSKRTYNAMRAMSTALPNLQQLFISNLRGRRIYSNGDDPDEEIAAETAHYTTHDINIITRFRKLRVLIIDTISMNGRYPILFNFSYLQCLHINCDFLKWDLHMLSGFPSLKELELNGTHMGKGNSRLTGNIRSLRSLRGTLEKVRVFACHRVEGNLMDLADFPRLRKLNLLGTTVTGDIRYIHVRHFQALEYLALPDTVLGGMDYEFQNISDVPSFMQAVHRLTLRTPTLFYYCDQISVAFYWNLSTSSPDWYHPEVGRPRPPFHLQFIQAGTRLGWSWCSGDSWNHLCEINWLDPEPANIADYDAYVEELHRIQWNIIFYRGYFQPPNMLDYRRLCEGLP